MSGRVSSFQNIGLSKVILNVYDLNPESNEILYQFGLGMYHSGVQIGGNEWTFAAGGGVYSHEPKGAGGAKFRESIDMGNFSGTQRDLDRALDELRDSFKGPSYHILTKNCNSFAEALVLRLLNKSIPAYVNRMAFIGSFFSCLLPPSISNDAPVNQIGSSTSASINPFAGQGRRLLSDTDSTFSSKDGNTDEMRKDRIRQAALARLQSQQK